MKATTEEAEVDLFNQKHPIGTRIRYKSDKGEIVEAEIRSPADLTQELTPCVYVRGNYNAVHLKDVIK